ncbi:MAG: DUF882 domain-containing protein [bacterium]
MFSETVSRRTFLKTALAGAFCLWSGQAFSEGRPPNAFEGRLSLYNTHTDERLEIVYRDRDGHYDPDALDAVNRLLRCHYTNEVARMDIGVIEYLNAMDKNLGGKNNIHIVSGFRSRAYNDLLLREGRGVVPHSLHLAAKAIDFRIPGVGLKTMRRTALGLAVGGVGYYPASDFIHIDSGRVRSW